MFYILGAFTVIIVILVIASYFRYNLALPALLLFHIRSWVAFLLSPNFKDVSDPLSTMNRSLMLVI